MSYKSLRRLVGFILPLLIVSALQAQTITNPSFEANGDFSSAPGYASNNGGVITGWAMSDPTRTGINTVVGPFYNNGILPNGTRVGFLQSTGATNAFFTNTITGLAAGVTYQVSFRANMRAGYANPSGTWSLNGSSFVSFTASPAVNAAGVYTNAFYTNSATFTATNTSALMVLRNQTTLDSTILLDDFTIATVAGSISPTATTLAATGVSNTVAQLNGTVNPNASSTTVWFEWGLSPYTNTSTTTPVAVGNGATAVIVSNALSGLTAGLNYHCRMVASNASGVVRGSDVTFGSPVVVLNNAATLTNECHTTFTDPYAANPVSTINAALAISAGNTLSLGLRADRTVAAWGVNTYTQTNVPAGLSNVVGIAAGSYHNLALKSDGTVVAWGTGTNTSGTDFNFGQAIVPSGLTSVVAVAAGYNHSVALKSTGTVTVWGDSGNSVTTNPPVNVTNVMAIAAGEWHTAALRSNGTVVAWGYNQYTETNVPASLSNVVSIAAGLFHNLALKRDGTVVGWGAGTNTSGSPNLGQVIIPSGLSNVVAVAAGNYHSLALKSDGTVVAWGSNSQSQTNVPAGLTNVVAIAGGATHSLALKSDGTLIGWGGFNVFGITTAPASLTNLVVAATTGGTFNTNNSPGSYQLTYFITNGLGGAGSVSRTVVVQDTIRPVVTMLGSNPLTNTVNTSFVDPGATALDACGGNLPLNTNSTVNMSVPGSYTVTYTATDSSSNSSNVVRTVVVVSPPVVTTLPATAVSNSIATLNGTVNPVGLVTTAWFEWGLSSASNINTTASVAAGSGQVSVPASNLLSGLTPGIIYRYRVVASNSVGVARGSDVLFGSPALSLNGAATLTNECHAAFTDPGVAVTPEPTVIAAGSKHALALKSGASLVAWGNNSNGQTNVPVGLNNVIAIAGGYAHSLAVKSDGTVVGWGANDNNQISIPGGLNNVTTVAASGANSLALKSDGTVVHWGANISGALDVPGGLNNVMRIAAGNIHNLVLRSNGTVTIWGYASGAASPPAGLTNVTAIAAGSFHNLALKSDGTVVAWGNNSYGEASVPAGLNNVVAIAGGYYHSVALKSNGTVVAWGNNIYGQTNTAGLNNVVAIAAGDDYGLALKGDGTLVAWGLSSDGQTTIPGSLSKLTATVSGSVNTNSPATYTLNYTVTNSLGGSATATRTVVVRDTLPPVLTRLGSSPVTNWLNVPFTDPGATALDACGGNMAVTTNNAVDVNVPGTYTITYTVADSFGNAATNTRTVVVVAPSSPILSVSNLTASNAMFISFQLTNSTGASFSVLASTNLASSMNTWSNLGAAIEVPSGSGQFQFTDPNATNSLQRFYRVKTP